MFEVTSKTENGAAVVALSGRVDSTNAAAAEEQIFAAVGDAETVTLDAEKLAYLSSAGLRVILRLKKARPELKIVNVSPDVYDIFEMTGFTEMMEISKAYRNISIEGCEVIGEGANGLVYRIDADTIVKVYKNPDSLEEIHRERELARKAFVMGVPTAIPYDVVRVGERYGSVFELLNARSFAKLLIADPSKTEELARESVVILKAIHGTHLKPGELPDKKVQALVWADYCRSRLPEDVGEKLCRLVREIPDTDNMLHGDFHIKNIMRQNGENLLIDMDTLSMGHPIFEFAAIFLAYIGYCSVDKNNVMDFFGIPYEQGERFVNETLRSYFGTDDPAYLENILNMAAVIGYSRLLRWTERRAKPDDELAKRQIEYCRQELVRLVPQMEKLYF